MLHLRWHTWEKTLTKHSSTQSFCTGSDDPGLPRMIRPYTKWSGPRSSSVFLAYSIPTPDDSWLLRMIREPPENTQRSLSGVGVYIPLHPLHLLLSLFPTNHASEAFNTSFLSILELDSCKETPRDWEEVRFEVWFESTLWASTCSSQEALEAIFDSSIRICYSWSLTPWRLEVPVSFYSFVVEPGSLYYPVLCGHLLVSISILPRGWLSEGKGYRTTLLFVSTSTET